MGRLKYKEMLSKIEELQKQLGVLKGRISDIEDDGILLKARVGELETNADIASATKEEQLDILHDWLLGKDERKKGEDKK